MDEVKAGNAKTTVAMLVDNFGDDELVTYLKSGFAASDSGITLSNLKFTEVNGLTNVMVLEESSAETLTLPVYREQISLFRMVLINGL